MTEQEYQKENAELRLMIKDMRQRINELLEENDRLTCLNRHYLHHFFNGDISKMISTFNYLMKKE